MSREIVVAVFLLVWLVFFILVNLHNILFLHRRGVSAHARAEVRRPSGLAVAIVALGTGLYFLEVCLYAVLAFSGTLTLLHDPLSDVLSPFTSYTLAPGLLLTSMGYSLFIWSVITRGRYAVSWAMPEDQSLVTWGPYRYVRHPSYLGYFLMFLGLFFLWPILFSLIPLAAIPGYWRVVPVEERFLLERFGDTYAEYQKRTGRFFPKL